MVAGTLAGLFGAASPAWAEESLGEKVTDAAENAVRATNQTARKVGETIEEKVDELRGEAAPTPVHNGNKVEVTLTDHSIQMPAAIPAGPTTFVVTNRSAEKQRFGIDGSKVDRELSKSLLPGETALLTVDLPAGNYDVENPDRDHDDRKQSLTVR